MSIQFHNPSVTDFVNARLCNEPLFLCVENKIGELPENIECIASPYAFCVEDELIEKAKNGLKDHSCVEIGDGEELLIRFIKKDVENAESNRIYIEHNVIKNSFDFFEACEKVKMQIIYKHIKNGVIFASIDGVIISPFARIGIGTEIHGTTEIRGNTEIGANCIIGPCSVITNGKIGNDCVVNATVITDAELENNVQIGPFSQVRPNSKLCSGVKIGDFVEIKNSVIGTDTHASHLTYIGDSDVGSRVNFGCGVITSNYDGKNKYRTKVGNDVFVGCNTNLVSPVVLGDGSYVAAGSTITQDVPEGALGIARSYQSNKEEWATKRRAEGKLK